MPLSFNYDVLPSIVLGDPTFFTHKVPLMKALGLRNLWLCTNIYTFWQDSPEDVFTAKRRLEDEGFEVEAVCVPLGHGGCALSGGDVPDPTLPSHFRNRIDASGCRMGNTTCVDQGVIDTYRDIFAVHKELGFKKIFHDDDLRMGMWGESLQGCYCPRCLDRFYQKYPQYSGISQTEIAQARQGEALFDAWADIQCEAVLRFLVETTPDGMTAGIMVMHNGDPRHGIDIPRIKAALPDTLFRVGECHFSDAAFQHPLARPAIERSIKKHLALIGSVDKAYSETTTYPVGALSPANFVEKLRWEISCGLRNIFLMSGSVFLTDDYWEALISAREELAYLADVTPLPLLDGTPITDDFIWHG